MTTNVTLPAKQATTRDQLHWSKALSLSLLFNDNVSISLPISSFLIKNSHLFDGFDDFTEKIPILCPSTYITRLIRSDAGLWVYKCLFDDKTDLYFILTVLPDKFIEICKFLDIICYENNDKEFSKQFIIYVMDNIKKHINMIQYFMRNEIRSILNYINNLSNNLSHNDEIMCCAPEFYILYLTEYKEEVIKYNRIDIYNKFIIYTYDDYMNDDILINYELDIYNYYRYVHLYDNHLSCIIKQTQEYNNYIININNTLILRCDESPPYIDSINIINDIKELIEQGANINFRNKHDYTGLHYASSRKNNLEVIKYIVENGADINIQNSYGDTALHFVVEREIKFEIIKYLVEHGANVNLQNRHGYTILHKVIILHKIGVSFVADNLLLFNVVKCLVEHGANVNLQNNIGNTALHYAVQCEGRLEIIQYLIEHCTNVGRACDGCNSFLNIQNNYGKKAIDMAERTHNNLKVINYLQEAAQLQQIT